MSDSKISSLPAATAFGDTDLAYIVQGATDLKISGGVMANSIVGSANIRAALAAAASPSGSNAFTTAAETTALAASLAALNEYFILVQDTFTGADSTDLVGRAPAPVNRPAGVYTAQGLVTGQDTAFQIQGNRARSTGSVYPATCVIETHSSNVIISATLKALYASAQAGLAFRYADHENFWCAWIFENYFRLSKYVAGSPTDVVSLTPTLPYNVDHVMEVSLLGNGISVAVNGTTLYSTNDAFSTSATQHGLWTNTLPGEWDDFQVMNR